MSRLITVNFISFNLWLVLCSFTAAASLSSPVFAGSGDLDKSFGSKGKVTAPQSNGGAQDLAIQSNGKIVAAGASLVRYMPNGALDVSFGTNGEVATGVNLSGVAVQADGKIVVIVAAGAGSDFILKRYTASGIADGGFGSSGQVTIDFGGVDSGAEIAIQGDGKVLAVGSRNGTDFALARLNSNGSLDAGFGSGGKTLATSTGEASAVRVQPDGKIVVAGLSTLVRFLSDGNFDPAFGSAGRVAGLFNGGLDLAIQADGKILVGGHNGVQGGDFAVARYTPNGSPDSTFGIGGKVTTDFFGDSDIAYGVGVQSDGKIILAGTSYHLDFQGGWTNPIWEFALARYNPNGSLDLTFGPNRNGKVITNVVWFDYGEALALQSDGKIVMGGLTYGNRPGDIATYALVRYLP